MPLPRHAGTGQNEIDAAVNILLGVIVRPGDWARFISRFGIGVTIALGGMGVDQFGYSVSDNYFGRGCVLGVVQVAKNEEICRRLGGKPGIDFLSQ